jgi:hypothetical protein
VAVDSRPQIERTARRALLAGAWLIASCATLGGCSFAYLAFHHTKPRSPK